MRSEKMDLYLLCKKLYIRNCGITVTLDIKSREIHISQAAKIKFIILILSYF